MSQKLRKILEKMVEPITNRIGHCWVLRKTHSSRSNKFSQNMVLQSEEITQSDEQYLSAIEAAESSHQTVTFTDNAVGSVVTLPTSDNTVAKVDNTDDVSLGQFLSRPTLIDTTTWTTSDTVGVLKTVQPWYAFLNSTAIKRKIENFAFLRGNLHIKVLINGTPFQYGAMRLCYSPLLGEVSDKIRTNPSSTIALGVPYSQQPGFYIYPQANAGGEMTCRFFYNKNWLALKNSATVQNMGTLNYFIYSTLGVAVSGGSSSVTLRTYAWMTDVQLMGPTTDLVLQSDEYGTGPISRPASAIADVASQLSKIPIIGRFARATQLGASAVSKIATLFGYTNVPVIADIHGYQPMNAPMLASANIGTPVQKLTLDPKQELSIDPSYHGIGSEDEMSLAYLKKRESYFAKTTWSTADASGTQIFNMNVTPMVHDYVSLVNTVPAQVGTRHYDTPLSYIGRAFRSWRGDLKLRIKVVCTKFHKGRLKISYAPRGDLSSIDPAENMVYTEILDVGETDDLVITIPFHQDLGWLRCFQSNSFKGWNTGGALAQNDAFENGQVTIRVLNSLTAPAAGTIDVLFSIVAGDSFEFCNPFSQMGSQIPISFFQLQAEDLTNIVPNEVCFGTPTHPLPERYGQNFGECISSLRVLLHRSAIFETTPFALSTANAWNVIYKTFKRMPYTPGYDPSFPLTVANKVVAASGTAPFCWNTMHPLPYFTSMYLGYRGSVNYHITPYCNTDFSVDDMRVIRAADFGSDISLNSRLVDSRGTCSYAFSNSVKFKRLNAEFYPRNGNAGMAINATRTNGTLSFNFPDYNNFNFSFADPSKYLYGAGGDGTTDQNVLLLLNFQTATATNTDRTIQIECGAGPDFTCLHFLCCPTIDALDSLPATS